jgi:3-phosphoshikimate 1-carboxyvinyltransferase
LRSLHVASPPQSSVQARGVPPARRVRGSLRLPGDKSVSHRAALLNAVAAGTATITNFAPGADCASTLSALRPLGVQIERDGDRVRVKGTGLKGLHEPADVLDCGNSGTTIRLLCGLVAGQRQFVVLTGDASLRRRPMARVVEPLSVMGARIVGRDGNRLPPLAIAPADGLRSMSHHLTVASAQVKSALLLAGLFADGPTTVQEPAPSRDHTERLLRAMGGAVQVEGRRISVLPADRLPATDVIVPGDFSSAAFWLVLGCLHPDAEIRVRGVGVNPTRTGLLTVLELMGADFAIENPREEAGEPVADIVTRSSRLRGTSIGGELVPLTIDELPLVALLGLFAEGETVVRDASELRVKESDRIAVVAEGLQALGGDVEAAPDGWRVRPSRLHASRVDSHGDHRIAMLFALAGALGEGAEIAGADAVSVSYPGFWHDLEEVTAA